MKNETARREIESLDYYFQHYTRSYSEKSHVAMMTAIKALKQEPCEDAISRQAVRKLIIKNNDMYGYSDRFHEFTEECLALPSVQPISRWIPVSERLPEENKTVMASTEYGVFPEAKYTKEYGWEWAYEAGADYWKELEDVTAWMPLPKPYKVDPQESEG